MSAGRRDGTASAGWQALGCEVLLAVTDPGSLASARDLLVAELDELDRAASRFRDDSEVSELARAGGRPKHVSDTLMEATAIALGAAALTDGDLDPTMGAELAALGYDRTFAQVTFAEIPFARVTGSAPQVAGRPESARTPAAALDVRPRRSWRDVVLDPEASSIQVPAGMMLDLGATAKAWCADRAAERIADEIGCGVLVSLGGDVRCVGPAPEGGWIVRVQERTGDPRLDVEGASQTVALRSGGLATSGTSVRRWRRAGSVLHHILDPRTSGPANDIWSTVTVAAPTCLLANIAATTSVIRGYDAVRWLRELDLPVRLVPRAGEGRPRDIVLMGAWPQDARAA